MFNILLVPLTNILQPFQAIMNALSLVRISYLMPQRQNHANATPVLFYSSHLVPICTPFSMTPHTQPLRPVLVRSAQSPLLTRLERGRHKGQDDCRCDERACHGGLYPCALLGCLC